MKNETADVQTTPQPKVLFTVVEGSILATLLLSLQTQWAARSAKYNHSVEYWAETCLADGISAHARQLKGARQRDTDSAYIAELQRLDATAPDYAEKLAKVNARFGVGGTQIEVNPRLATAKRMVTEL